MQWSILIDDELTSCVLDPRCDMDFDLLVVATMLCVEGSEHVVIFPSLMNES